MSANQTLPSEPINLPLLPLRDVVVFPHMVIPLFVGRPRSIRALEAAMEAGKSIMLAAQKSAGKDDPTPDDVYEIGCIATILQMLKLPDGTVKVLVEGAQRARVTAIQDVETHFTSEVLPLTPDATVGAEIEALRRAIVSQFEQYVKLNKKIPPEILTSLAGIDDAGRLADTIAAHLPLKLEQKQKMLEIFPTAERLEALLAQLETEIDILQVEKRIRGRVKKQMEKSQRDYYLNEQVKAIQKELGEGEEGADIEELEKKIIAAHLPKDARKKVDSELKKLKLMSPMSAEATVVRNYIDTVIALPWRKKSKVNNSIPNAESVLDNDHYGLDKVKERILEYLAVQQRVDKVKAPILCLVGPPGVGKTSLGQSIAKATNLKYHIDPDRWMGEMRALKYLIDFKRSHVLIIKYEDLVTDPDLIQLKISTFFNLEIKTSMDNISSVFNASAEAISAMHGQRKIDKNSINKFRSNPNKIEYLKSIRPKLGLVLDWVADAFDYDVDLLE